ncbi:MAG: hypothetical protein ACLFQK_04615 [Fibrobacterota bacterium]
MHTEQIISQMKQMRLSAMAESFRERISSSNHTDLTNEEFLGLLI